MELFLHSPDPHPEGSENHPAPGCPWCHLCRSQGLDTLLHMAQPVSSFCVWLMHRHRLAQILSPISLPQLSFDPQPDLSLGGGKTRNTQKQGVQTTGISQRDQGQAPAATQTLPCLHQGARGNFLPSQEGHSQIQFFGSAPQEGPFQGSIPWICPSGRVIPKFNPPGSTLPSSRASSAQPPSHSHRLIG